MWCCFMDLFTREKGKERGIREKKKIRETTNTKEKEKPGKKNTFENHIIANANTITIFTIISHNHSYQTRTCVTQGPSWV